MTEPEERPTSGIRVNLSALVVELREINKTLKMIAHELRKGRPS